MKNEPEENGGFLHLSFWIALFLKAINAFAEVIGGICLIFLTPGSANRFIRLLTREELAEDPRDFLANTLVHFGGRYSLSSQHFGIFYFLSHGIIKLVLVALLWRRKLWAYPLTAVVLALFIVYQVYRIVVAPTSTMIFLTVFDLAVIFLTLNEYRTMKKKQQNEKNAEE